MTLMSDIKAGFKAKGLEFVSITESTKDPDKSTLTYKDASGATATREVSIRLEDLEDTVMAVEGLDPEDIATFLLGNS